VRAVRHPVFARVFNRMSEREEGMGQAEHRQAMLDGVAGRLVELGAGNGINFKHYPPAVSEVLAVEPEPYLRERAEEAARRAAVPVAVVDEPGVHVRGHLRGVVGGILDLEAHGGRGGRPPQMGKRVGERGAWALDLIVGARGFLHGTCA